MCGRFAQAVQPNALVPRLQREVPNVRIVRWQDENEQNDIRPRFNTGPRSNVPVIRRRGGENQVKVMNWGLVPHWTKHEPSYGDNLNTINARSEQLVGIEQPGMWKSMAPTKRCIVPVQGWFEWVNKGKQKIPYFIRHPDPTSTPSTDGVAAQTDPNATNEPPFVMFAGLWDECQYEETDGPPITTFTILTTSTSKQLDFIHTRMPVILHSEEDMNTWLDCDPTEKDASKRGSWTSELANLCKPYGKKEGFEDLTCYQVPSEVGKVQNQSESFIHPVSERKDGIERFFKKTTTAPSAPPPAPDIDTLNPPCTSASSSTKGKTKEESVSISDDDDEEEEVKPVSPPSGQGKKRKAEEEENKDVKGEKEEEEEEMIKGEKDEGEVVLEGEDDEVIFVGEDRPKTKKGKPSPASSTKKSSSAGSKAKPRPPKKKEKITSFFKKV